MQLARRAFSLALAKTGNKIAARIDIIAITTSSSIKVKPAKEPLLQLPRLVIWIIFIISF